MSSIELNETQQKIMLSELRQAVSLNIAMGDIDLKVTNAQGRKVFIVALDDEKLLDVMERAKLVGGYVTLFALNTKTGLIRSSAILPRESAIFDAQSSLEINKLSGNAPLGAFLDYLEQVESIEIFAAASDYRESGIGNVNEVELATI